MQRYARRMYYGRKPRETASKEKDNNSYYRLDITCIRSSMRYNRICGYGKVFPRGTYAEDLVVFHRISFDSNRRIYAYREFSEVYSEICQKRERTRIQRDGTANSPRHIVDSKFRKDGN